VDDWEELYGTNNPVEFINRQSVPGNVKSIYLKPLLEHSIWKIIELQPYKLQQRQVSQFPTRPGNRKTCRPSKAPESRSAVILVRKKAIGLRVSVEFYENDHAADN